MLTSTSAYDNTTRSLAALIQSVDELNRNPQIASSILYDNWNGSLKELRDSVKDFRQNPRKYLRIKLF
ncbi:MAG: hypothetical protein WDO73_23670 [Ignavibacteriota bacterium]